MRRTVDVISVTEETENRSAAEKPLMLTAKKHTISIIISKARLDAVNSPKNSAREGTNSANIKTDKKPATSERQISLTLTRKGSVLLNGTPCHTASGESSREATKRKDACHSATIF